jgi:hypothetical protein
MEDGEQVPVGYHFVKCHMIFDVKSGRLKQKASYVSSGHVTEAPSAIMYSSVVSRESIRIGLLIAALNGLEVFAVDIQNAFLTIPCEEKIYTILDEEFGTHRKGKKAIVVRASYGLKSAGASFRNHLASCLGRLGFTASRGEYYKYLFVYTDDILAIGVNPKDILMKLNKYFKLEPDSIHPPDDYLGTKIKKTVLRNGASAWGQSSSQYVRNAVKNLEEWIFKEGKKLPKKADNTMSSTYKPEVDVSPDLSLEMANFYQSQVGLLRWIIEMRRLDITTEVSVEYVGGTHGGPK